MSRTKLFYIDTNCILNARQFLACKLNNVNENYYPASVRTGIRVTEALDECREKRNVIEVKTSLLTNFEMNFYYRLSIRKGLFLEYGVPLETIDGREQDIHSNWEQRPLDMREKFTVMMKDSIEWYLNWEYKDVVDFTSLDNAIFTIADPMQFWSPGIELMDALHLAMALNMGANYFVSNDEKLISRVRVIAIELDSIGRLPNGSAYVEKIEPLKPGAFLDLVRSIRLSEETKEI